MHTFQCSRSSRTPPTEYYTLFLADQLLSPVRELTSGLLIPYVEMFTVKQVLMEPATDRTITYWYEEAKNQWSFILWSAGELEQKWYFDPGTIYTPPGVAIRDDTGIATSTLGRYFSVKSLQSQPAASHFLTATHMFSGVDSLILPVNRLLRFSPVDFDDGSTANHVAIWYPVTALGHFTSVYDPPNRLYALYVFDRTQFYSGLHYLLSNAYMYVESNPDNLLKMSTHHGALYVADGKSTPITELKTKCSSAYVSTLTGYFFFFGGDKTLHSYSSADDTCVNITENVPIDSYHYDRTCSSLAAFALPDMREMPMTAFRTQNNRIILLIYVHRTWHAIAFILSSDGTLSVEKRPRYCTMPYHPFVSMYKQDRLAGTDTPSPVMMFPHSGKNTVKLVSSSLVSYRQDELSIVVIVSAYATGFHVQQLLYDEETNFLRPFSSQHDQLFGGDNTDVEFTRLSTGSVITGISVGVMSNVEWEEDGDPDTATLDTPEAYRSKTVVVTTTLDGSSRDNDYVAAISMVECTRHGIHFGPLDTTTNVIQLPAKYRESAQSSVESLASLWGPCTVTSGGTSHTLLRRVHTPSSSGSIETLFSHKHQPTFHSAVTGQGYINLMTTYASYASPEDTFGRPVQFQIRNQYVPAIYRHPGSSVVFKSMSLLSYKMCIRVENLSTLSIFVGNALDAVETYDITHIETAGGLLSVLNASSYVHMLVTTRESKDTILYQKLLTAMSCRCDSVGCATPGTYEYQGVTKLWYCETHLKGRAYVRTRDLQGIRLEKRVYHHSASSFAVHSGGQTRSIQLSDSNILSFAGVPTIESLDLSNVSTLFGLSDLLVKGSSDLSVRCSDKHGVDTDLYTTYIRPMLLTGIRFDDRPSLLPVLDVCGDPRIHDGIIPSSLCGSHQLYADATTRVGRCLPSSESFSMSFSMFGNLFNPPMGGPLIQHVIPDAEHEAADEILRADYLKAEGALNLDILSTVEAFSTASKRLYDKVTTRRMLKDFVDLRMDYRQFSNSLTTKMILTTMTHEIEWPINASIESSLSVERGSIKRGSWDVACETGDSLLVRTGDSSLNGYTIKKGVLFVLHSRVSLSVDIVLRDFSQPLHPKYAFQFSMKTIPGGTVVYTQVVVNTELIPPMKTSHVVRLYLSFLVTKPLTGLLVIDVGVIGNKPVRIDIRHDTFLYTATQSTGAALNLSRTIRNAVPTWQHIGLSSIRTRAIQFKNPDDSSVTGICAHSLTYTPGRICVSGSFTLDLPDYSKEGGIPPNYLLCSFIHPGSEKKKTSQVEALSICVEMDYDRPHLAVYVSVFVPALNRVLTRKMDAGFADTLSHTTDFKFSVEIVNQSGMDQRADVAKKEVGTTQEEKEKDASPTPPEYEEPGMDDTLSFHLKLYHSANTLVAYPDKTIETKGTIQFIVWDRRTEPPVPTTHKFNTLDFTKTVLCIGGYESGIGPFPAYDFEGDAKKPTSNFRCLDQHCTLNAFSVTTTEKSVDVCFADIGDAISVDDELYLGVDTVPFDEYVLFIVPSAVIPDKNIYNQCMFKSVGSTISPTERQNSMIQSRNPLWSHLTDVVDTTVISRVQNRNHALLVIGNKVIAATSVRSVDGAVPSAIAVSDAGEDSLHNLTGFNSAKLPYDMTNSLVNTRLSRKVGQSLITAGNTHWPITSLRFFDKGLSTSTLKDGQLVMDPGWCDPVYFFRPYELQTTGWVDAVSGKLDFVTTTPLKTIDLYPTHTNCSHTAGGFSNILSYGSKCMDMLQYAGITSMVVSSADVYKADIFVRLEQPTSTSTSFRSQAIDRERIGRVEKRFVRQVLSGAVLKGYIEGPPPCPGENLSNVIHGSHHYASLGDTVFQKAEQTAHTKSAKTYFSAGSTSQFSWSVSLGFQIDLGFSLGKHIVKSQSFWGSVGGSVESSESNRTALSSSHNQECTNKLTEYMIQITGSQECVNSRDISADRPNMPTRFVVDNVGVAYVSAEVRNEFVHTFNGIPFLTEVLPLDPPQTIDLSIPFPINPLYRVVGSLDGTMGLTAADLSLPFIHPTLRNDLTVEGFNDGTKSSYCGHAQDAAIFDKWVTTKGASDYNMQVSLSMLNVRRKYDLESDPWSGKIGAIEYLTYDKKTIAGDASINSYRCENPGIDDGVKNHYNILFPSIKQSSSVRMQTATSRSGHASSSRASTKVIDDKYSIQSRRTGFSVGLEGQKFIFRGAVTGAFDFDHVWEHSMNDEITTDYSTQVSNNVPDDLYDSSSAMYFENLLMGYDQSQYYLGQNVSLEGPLFEALAIYDQVVVNHYRGLGKKCVAVGTQGGRLMLAHTDAYGDVRPLPRPGTVVSYQYDTYLITRHPNSWIDFFNRVADPLWVKTDPLAKELEQSGNPPLNAQPDRTTHFVNYIERNVAELSTRAPTTPATMTFINVMIFAGDAIRDLPVGTRVVPFEYFHRMQKSPRNLGYILQMMDMYPTMVGYIISQHRIIAAVVADDTKTYYSTVLASFAPETPVSYELYLVQRHHQAWNSSNTLLLDAKFIADGQPGSTLLNTNSGIIDSVKTPTGDSRDYIPGSTLYIENRLEVLGVGTLVYTLTRTLLYYFYAMQTNILSEYQRYTTLQSAGLDASLTSGSRLPIVKESRPEGLVLEVRETSLRVYLTKEPHHRLPTTSWWGICPYDNYVDQSEGFTKWNTFGYVAHQPDDFHVLDTNRMTTVTNACVDFVVPTVDLQDRLYVFAVYTEDDVELQSQAFHPQVYNPFIDAYRWNREVSTKAFGTGTSIQTRYKSSTEHGVIVTSDVGFDTGSHVEVYIDQSGHICTKDSECETAHAYTKLRTVDVSPILNGVFSDGMVVVVHSSHSNTQFSFSIFGAPGYYKLILINDKGDLLCPALETFLGTDAADH